VVALFFASLGEC
jgi:hypothetical protein